MPHPPGRLSRDAFLSGLGDDAPLACHLAQLYADSAPDMRRDLERAVAEAQGPAVVAAAHALAGMVGNFPGARAHRLAKEVERLGRADQLGGLAPLVGELARALDELHGDLADLARDLA